MTEQEAIEQCKLLHGFEKEANTAMDMAIKALEEIQQYRAIGTVEECREAVERQKMKKPVKRSFIIPHEGIDVCPNCKEPISKKEHHCKCGQAIDWSDNWAPKGLT